MKLWIGVEDLGKDFIKKEETPQGISEKDRI
jgi:hypothetical protein